MATVTRTLQGRDHIISFGQQGHCLVKLFQLFLFISNILPSKHIGGILYVRNYRRIYGCVYKNN